ncbi:Peptidoglycan/xylan/chitin deacetylase, PgdA/CDA1 family [Paenibacillus sp. yr247]|nr:Peptidoglycan/xylan/chitin deacetylase, PgdA/CDA1 family [Paenibacillus sp. yr247]
MDSALDERVINHVTMTKKQVALTFDDGPDDKYTLKILDILKANGIKATFFVVGEHAAKYPAVLRRIVQEGHVVGNHSWDHPDLLKLSNELIRNEITKTDDVIRNISGASPTLFRAPYGAVNNDVRIDAASTGHHLIGWSVDTLDWKGKSTAEIINAVKKEVTPGAIILQHSAGGKGGNLTNTIQALPQIISYLKQNNYSFVTVPELLSAETH